MIKEYINPILSSIIGTGLLISCVMFYIDATVGLPGNRLGTEHIQPDIGPVKIGSIFTKRISRNATPIKNIEFSKCKELSSSPLEVKPVSWFSLNGNLKVPGATGGYLGVSNSRIGAVCIWGDNVELKYIEALARKVELIDGDVEITSLPEGGTILSVGEEITYPREYSNMGAYLKSLRHEIVSELDADRKHYDYNSLSLYTSHQAGFEISMRDRMVLPELSAEKRQDRLDELEDAFEKFEQKFMSYQLDSNWMMRSRLIMKIYFILGEIS